MLQRLFLNQNCLRILKNKLKQLNHKWFRKHIIFLKYQRIKKRQQKTTIQIISLFRER